MVYPDPNRHILESFWRSLFSDAGVEVGKGDLAVTSASMTVFTQQQDRGVKPDCTAKYSLLH